MTTLETIQQLDNFKTLRFYEHISNELFSATNADAATLMEQMPKEISNTEQLQQVQEADEEVFDKPLDNQEAIAFARRSLELLASQPATEPLIAEELKNWKDDSMIAGTILAVGGAISLIMLLATTEISYDKQNGLKIGIGTIKDKDQVHARIDMIKALFETIPGLKKLLGK